jgi:16S rRNA processing protein RimM
MDRFMNEQVLKVGVIRKAHGLNGELKIEIFHEFIHTVKQKMYLLVETRGSYIPYFITSIRSQDPYIVQFEALINSEDAKRIQGSAAFLKKQDVPEMQKKIVVPRNSDQYVGYTILNESDGLELKILEIRSLPMQELFVTETEGVEILIPIVEQWVLGIDMQFKIIKMKLPDGLY